MQEKESHEVTKSALAKSLEEFEIAKKVSRVIIQICLCSQVVSRNCVSSHRANPYKLEPHYRQNLSTGGSRKASVS